MDDATEGKVEEGKQEIFTLRRVPSAKLTSSWDKLGSALCISKYYYSHTITWKVS